MPGRALQLIEIEKLNQKSQMVDWQKWPILMQKERKSEIAKVEEFNIESKRMMYTQQKKWGVVP